MSIESQLEVHSPPRRLRRYRLLYTLEAKLEVPMFLLSLTWLWLFVKELAVGLTPRQQFWVTAIWIVFICEYLFKLLLAKPRLAYLQHNWIAGAAIFLPALRIFRLLRALRVLSNIQVLNTLKFIRALMNTKRVVTTIREVQGEGPGPQMDVGILVAHSILADKDALHAFAERTTDLVKQEMKHATGITWNFHFTDPAVLNSDSPRQPTDFIEEASLRMAQGPYDMLLVVTDVALMSRRKTIEAGLSSPVSRTMVISTRKLTAASRKIPAHDLLSDNVTANAATLLLHLLGYICGLKRSEVKTQSAMSPFIFKDRRQKPDGFTAQEKTLLGERSGSLPDREMQGGGIFASFAFHVFMALRHPVEVLYPLLASRALFLPLSLPGLTTAAIAPAFLLIFTAEIWDVGMGMTNVVAAWYAVVSILAATWYLVRVQSLLLPRQEKRILTEHLALTNSVIFLSILLAVIGLFLMETSLMLVLEFYIFPEDLMSTWPTLEHGDISLADKIRLAVFISTVGVTTGALAGGLEGRSVMRHLALFAEKP